MLPPTGQRATKCGGSTQLPPIRSQPCNAAAGIECRGVSSVPDVSQIPLIDLNVTEILSDLPHRLPQKGLQEHRALIYEVSNLLFRATNPFAL